MTMNQIKLKKLAAILGARGGKATAQAMTQEQRTARASQAGKAGGRGRCTITSNPDGSYNVSCGSTWGTYYVESGKIWIRSGEDTPSKRRVLARWLKAR